MLQEASKILNSAFHNSFIKRLSLYLHDCVREEVQSSTFRNLKQDKDNKWIFLTGEEELYNKFPYPIKLDGSDSLLTELMIQAEMSQKDKYLIYGYLFLVGKNAKNRKQNEFLTPLLYMPLRLERIGLNIVGTLQDEVLSLNTGALAGLMNKNDDDDELEHLLDGLLDVVPELPLTQEKLDIFITTLKSIIPDVEVLINHEADVDEINVSDNNDQEKSDSEQFEELLDDEPAPKAKIKIDKVSLTAQSAIILTKRPQVTAGVLHELTQISEKPSGVFRETVLGLINEEFSQNKTKPLDGNKKMKSLDDFVATTPLSLSDSQKDVIRKIEEHSLLAVYGPPGTGKSQTIVNLVSHLIANGKTVLVASRMDKAIDVVADRLNELGAPFLALRSGRLNYQKQLSFQLQDLLSNKVDLDSGFENSILVDVEDMHKLIYSIKEFESSCEKILELESKWKELVYEAENQEQNIGQCEFITQKLKRDEINQMKSVLDGLENNLEKSGFLSNISNMFGLNKLKSILQKPELKIDFEDIDRIRLELKLAELTCQARETENKIHKIGNLHMLMGRIKMLKNKQQTLAVEILKNKRRECLKGLLRDQVKRQRLIIHSKALIERKKNLQNRLLEDEDFKPLLEAFPCWCVTTYAVSGSLPLKPGLFDVAIIDEASQCDIASCFPILFRAKKAVIVGDDKQLPHLSFLEKAKEQSFLSQYEIPDKYQLMWRFRTNSMFDLANYYSTSPVLLDEHFRSFAPIIEFSNQEFYGGRMRIMSKNSKSKDVLELQIVKDGRVDSSATQNQREVEEILKRVHEIILNDTGKTPVSIGILSPFRSQVELLKKALSQVLTDAIVIKHKIEVGTAHTFQGDERDIMILSFAVANNSFTQSLTFLQKPNLFNVAITRARKKLICFLSKEPKSLPQGLLRSYIEYIETYVAKNSADAIKLDENSYKNEFEKTIAEALRNEGYEVKAGVNLAGLNVDLLVEGPSDECFIVECDGVENSKRELISAMKKQAILERSGYRVNRITYREWHHSASACIERIKQL